MLGSLSCVETTSFCNRLVQLASYWRLIAMSFSRDDLCSRSGASGFRGGSMGRKAESVARKAQMITPPQGKLGVCAGEQGGHSLPRRSRMNTGNEGTRLSCVAFPQLPNHPPESIDFSAFNHLEGC